MEYNATKIKARNLKAGDLFSTEGKLYWNKENIKANKSVGEKVFIRTDEPCPKDQIEEEIYKIEIEN